MQKRYVRETSPYMQAFLVNLARDYYTSLRRGQWSHALLALQMLYDSLPEDVRTTVDKTFEQRGISGGFLGLREIIEQGCREIMTRYGERTSKKLRECGSRARDLLQAAYSVIMAKAYEYNIFFNIKTVEIGVGAEE